MINKIKRKINKLNEYDLWIREKEEHKSNYDWDSKLNFFVLVIDKENKNYQRCIKSIKNQRCAKFDIGDSDQLDLIQNELNDWVLLVDSSIILTENALCEMDNRIQKNMWDIVYFDEDDINVKKNKRKNPFFKPDWSPDTLMSFMYVGGTFAIKKSIFMKIIYNVDWKKKNALYDAFIRATEITDKVGHISQILFHNCDTQKKINDDDIKKAALDRRGLIGTLKYSKDTDSNRIVYKPIGNPIVSIIIPSKDNYAMLKTCIESIVRQTTYERYELILIDNGSNTYNYDCYKRFAISSNIKYVYDKMKFNFSKMCNIGAEKAKGDFLLFLNDDIEIPQNNKNWLEIMLGHAQLKHVGAVGAKLLYPNTDIIQHDGIVNLCNGPSHMLCKAHDNKNYYYGRNKVEYNFSSVTGACMMIEKKKFNKIGKFNEQLPIAYNDVDICLKAVENGYYNVVRNDVCLYHHESVSRGADIDSDKLARLQEEKKKLYMYHESLCKIDPFYNINLSCKEGDYSLNV